ncbi:uncharacterized protein [Typha angustifolia]|uniref:uncharacterized protein n=1 Tax=Typha angustifolia TaxID=59011 RepID=UPI003C2C1DBE
MAHHSHLTSLHSLYGLKVKSPYPRSTSDKLKSLLHAYIIQHMSHLVRAMGSVKSMITELLNKKAMTSTTMYGTKLRWRKKKKTKKFASISMHFNWSSSHVMPMSDPPTDDQMYYDSTWNSMISTKECDEDIEPPLSGYLRWLEEKNADDDEGSEIDRLAEKFIARCHEKFRLEKQESYRRYQEMLARSM